MTGRPTVYVYTYYNTNRVGLSSVEHTSSKCLMVDSYAYLVLKLRGEFLGLGYDVSDAVADVAADALETGAEPV